MNDSTQAPLTDLAPDGLAKRMFIFAVLGVVAYIGVICGLMLMAD